MVADAAATLLTNGGGQGDVSGEATQSSDSSPALSSEHPDKTSEDRPHVPASEDELGPMSKLAMCEEEEAEGTLVIRAERVVVTDEGNDVHEDLVALPDQLQAMQSEEAATSRAEEGQDVVVTEGIRTEMSTQGDDDDGTKLTVEKDMQDFTEAITDGPDEASESTSHHVQPTPGHAEAAALCPVPVYGESTLNPELPLEAPAAELLPEESQAAVKTQDPVPAAGHFQDVPLAEPSKQQQPEEQEPLLSQTTAPDICSEPAAAGGVTCSPEAQSAPKAGQGEDTQAPKHKSCQCCSVM